MFQKKIELVFVQVVAAAKLPVLNPNEFELWKIRIEQYFLMTDYALWEVILNGDSPMSTRTVDGVEIVIPPTTTEQKLAKRIELKARGTPLMALPNEHQLKFNTYKSTKTLMEAIENRFRGNKKSKKVYKTLLKQQYENFNGKSSEGLDQIYDRIQKLISQLEIHGETISQEDLNLKFLRSLSSKWKTHTLIWRNKSDLEDLNMDDLYNNLKIYEAELMGVPATDSNVNASTLPNVDSLSDAVIYSFFALANGNADYESKEISQEDMKESRGHFAKECKASKNQDNKNRETTRRIVPVEGSTSNALVSLCDGIGYDWSNRAKEGPTSVALMAYTSSSSSSSNTEVSTCSKALAYKAGLESVEARLDVYKKNEDVFEEEIKILKLDIMLRDNTLIELRKNFEKAEKERDDLKLTLEKFENSSKSLSKLLDSKSKLLDSKLSDNSKTGLGFDSQVFHSQVVNYQVNDKNKTGRGYHAFPPPYTRNFMPPKPDLVLADKDEYVFSESITSATSKVKTSVSKPKSVNEPLVEDCTSDSEDENETEPR
ncbi:hypothetical protein Tco_0595451 [Tanacetum coccineum]